MCSIGDEKGKKRAHVLAIPFHTQGHILPLLKLAKELSLKGVGITFVSYEALIAQVSSTESFELQSPDFQFVGLIDDHSPDEVLIPSSGSERLRKSFKPFLEKLISDKLSGLPGPTSILSDDFLTWTQDAADELQIPRYVFVASGGIYPAYEHGILEYFTKGIFRVSETDGKLVEFDGSVSIAGLFPLRYHELFSSNRLDPVGFFKRCQTIRKAAGILVNSIYELEKDNFAMWGRPGVPAPGLEQTKLAKAYPVGPLISTGTGLTVVEGLEDSAVQSLKWLDSQPACSVLYVAFGSWTRLSPEQIRVLAHGLESSKQRFLWVVPQQKVISAGAEEKSSNGITDLLPPGFEARVADRGCIVTGWVPQVKILAHPSTAVFLTHSGWNSTLESVTIGVPMISWPQAAEQHVNCRYMVDVLKVAEQLHTGPQNILEQKEVERVVSLLMVEPEGREIRKRVQELRRKLAEALAEGGSRSRVLNDFVEELFH